MGTWASPTTAEKAKQLAELMSRPLAVRGAEEMLHGIIGDDTLFDLIANARAWHPDADARSLVAVVLDDWLNWTPRKPWSEPWEPGVEETLRGILEEHVARMGDDDVLHRMAKYSEDDARAAVARCLGLKAGEKESLEVVRGLLPVVCEVRSPDGQRFRFDRIWSVVSDAPELEGEEPAPQGLSPVPASAA